MSLLTVLLSAALSFPLQQVPGGEGGDDLAVRLVQRIQQDLAEVDRLLDEASDSDELGDQLQEARGAHVRAISDLEELIRQIKYRRSGQPQSSGGGGGGGSQSQPSPREADDRQQTDTAPTPQSQGQPEERPAGEKEGGQQPQPTGMPDGAPNESRDANAVPPPDALDDFLRRDTDARWGVLPPKMQERLMNLHVDDMPARYRTWLEAYVRELNRRDTGDAP